MKMERILVKCICVYMFMYEWVGLTCSQLDKPLTDNELSHLCQISDHSSTNRILVKPLDYKVEQYRAYSKNGTNCYDFAVKPSGYQR